MHEFGEDVRKGGVHSAWCGGKVVDFVMENGSEVQFCFTDGTSARFEWLDDNGDPIKGKLHCKSLGVHIVAVAATVNTK